MKATVLDEALRVNNPCPKSVPKAPRKTYSTVCQLRIQAIQCLVNTMVSNTALVCGSDLHTGSSNNIT